MTPALTRAIRALGPDLSPAMMGGSQALFAPLVPPLPGDLVVARDIAYGPDARHRIDIFRKAGTRDAPVLLFVHGGGFVMGDKRHETLPFYDNVGAFAAAAGFVGVTMTYRLAPAHPWPAGAEDVGRAIGWLRGNAAQHGGDPAAIVGTGQSAGAVHVASYVAHPRFHGRGGSGLAGAVLLSGIYDVAAAHANPFHRAYYGEDAAAYPAASTLGGLIASDVPLLLGVSEHDIADFQLQAAGFVTAYAAAHGRYPRMLHLAGHNHITPVLSIGTSEDDVGGRIADFVRTATAGD
ncbi:MAG: alpha/beta hydrolase [Sphingomonas fennica]